MLIVDDKTLNMIKVLYEQSSISITTDKSVVTIKGKNSTYKASMLEKKSLPIINESNLISVKTSLKAQKGINSLDQTQRSINGSQEKVILSTDSYKAYLYNPSDLPVEEKTKTICNADMVY